MERVSVQYFGVPAFIYRSGENVCIDVDGKDESICWILIGAGGHGTTLASEEFLGLDLPDGRYYRVFMNLEIVGPPMPKGFRPHHLLSPQYNWEREYEEWGDE